MSGPRVWITMPAGFGALVNEMTGRLVARTCAALRRLAEILRHNLRECDREIRRLRNGARPAGGGAQ